MKQRLSGHTSAILVHEPEIVLSLCVALAAASAGQGDAMLGDRAGNRGSGIFDGRGGAGLPIARRFWIASVNDGIVFGMMPLAAVAMSVVC